MSTNASHARRFAGLTPRAQTIMWRIIAAVVLLGLALLCWHNIAQTLGSPVNFQLEDGEGLKLAAVTGGTAHATHTGIVMVGVDLTHISSQLQWLLALSILNGSIIQAAVIMVVGVIWVRTSGGHPFARTVTWSLTALAIIFAVLGTLQELLDSWVGLREAYDAVGANTDLTSPYADASGIQIPGYFILVALGIGVLASAFAIGARLTKDMEGLV